MLQYYIIFFLISMLNTTIFYLTEQFINGNALILQIKLNPWPQ